MRRIALKSTIATRAMITKVPLRDSKFLLGIIESLGLESSDKVTSGLRMKENKRIIFEKIDTMTGKELATLENKVTSEIFG